MATPGDFMMSAKELRGTIAIVGAGHVGATTAFALLLRGLFEEIVLIDSNADLAKAEAADIADASALTKPACVRAGSYEDAATARIVVITAGAASHGDESRLSLASRSAVIVADCVKRLAAAGFGGVLIIASNPVDLMTVVAIRHAGLPHRQVFGTGTLLDTSRLKQTLGAVLDVAPDAIEGYVLGEHGDSEVAAFSTVRIGGQSLGMFAPDGLDLGDIAQRVRNEGYRIIKGKGHTAFGIATAIVRMCEAVVRDERMVLPVSVWVGRDDGEGDLCMSLPCVIGARGIEKQMFPQLDEADDRALQRSAAALTEALRSMDAAD